MLATKPEILTNSFLEFAHDAANILHIKSNKANDTIDELLNDLIEIISKAIEKYESSLEDIVEFENEANNIAKKYQFLKF